MGGERGALATSELARMAADYNPRTMPAAEFASLRESLRRFGCVAPVVVNRRSQRIVGGHQRVAAAQAEGIESVPVVWVDLDDDSERAMNLALNRIGGEWDEAKLRDVLLALLTEDDADGVARATGFDAAELDRILARRLMEPPDEYAEPDETTAQACPACGYRW